jgi:hypothetical protein
VSVPPDVLGALLALLRGAAREGAAEALAAHATAAPSAPTQRLTLDALAHVEGCSRATIRRLTREGGPVHYLAASPRYDLADWRAWCEARGRAGTKAPARSSVAGVRLLSRGSR